MQKQTFFINLGDGGGALIRVHDRSPNKTNSRALLLLLFLPLFSTKVAKGLQDTSLIITSSGSVFLFITSFLLCSRSFFSTGIFFLFFSRTLFVTLFSLRVLNTHTCRLILSTSCNWLLHNLLDEFINLQLLLCANPDSLLKCFRGSNELRK